MPRRPGLISRKRKEQLKNARKKRRIESKVDSGGVIGGGTVPGCSGGTLVGGGDDAKSGEICKSVIPSITESEDCSNFQSPNICSQEGKMGRRNVRPSKAKRKRRSDASKNRWEIFRGKMQAQAESGLDGVDKAEEEGDDLSQDEVVEREDGGRGGRHSGLSNESSSINESKVITFQSTNVSCLLCRRYIFQCSV